jgi:hypothetical protein
MQLDPVWSTIIIVALLGLLAVAFEYELNKIRNRMSYIEKRILRIETILEERKT